MLEAETRFRKVEGYRGLATLAVKIEVDLIRRRQAVAHRNCRAERPLPPHRAGARRQHCPSGYGHAPEVPTELKLKRLSRRSGFLGERGRSVREPAQRRYMPDWGPDAGCVLLRMVVGGGADAGGGRGP
jgi:hypothetical protein